MDGTESLWISRVGEISVARLVESQIWHQLAGSVPQGKGEGLEKGQWPLLTFLSGRKLSPSSCIDATYFTFSLFATGAFQAATLVLELRGSESKSMCGFLKRNCLGFKRFSFTDSIPNGFCSQRLWGLIFLALEPWAGGPCVGLRLLSPKISLPNFYLPHVDMIPAHSGSVPLLPVWMEVVSLIP